MYNIDWDKVEISAEFTRPKPGGYIAEVEDFQDVEAKEYVMILWDFADGAFRGYNAERFDRFGKWPTKLCRSYKQKALPFFKAFKTSLEESNPGYRFECQNLEGMVGKRFGIVLGEEEFLTPDGNVKTRLYVDQTLPIQRIKRGDFEVPELKKLKASSGSGSVGTFPGIAHMQQAGSNSFSAAPDDGEDGELPF